MKKSMLILTLFLLSTTLSNAQWFSSRIRGNDNVINKTRNVGEYDHIAVAGAFDVTLVKGKEGKLEIEIEDNLLEYLITEVDGDKLKIKWEKGVNINTRKGVHIKVPFTDLDAVSLTGSGDINTVDTIVASSFKTSVSGSGDINLIVSAKQVTSKVTGSGDITLAGKTNTLKTSVTGSGDYHGFKLEAKDVEAKVTGSGDISVTALHEINARITGSGDIEFRGNPEFQNSKVTGSGDITGR